MAAAAVAPTTPPPAVRAAVRTLLLASPAYHELPPDKKKAMAESMVRVCHAAVALMQEEAESDDAARAVASGESPTLARAQSAGSDFSGVSAQRVASTTTAILNAVSFPRFVTDLINGVFKSIVDSSVQQMNSFVELLNNVSASVEGFTDMNMNADRARLWLVDKFPESYDLQKGDDDSSDGSGHPQATVVLKDGASAPSEAALRTALGASADESIPSGDPEQLVPLARRVLSQTRQQMLATMVMLGMQRIVIDSGRITASMRFHIDTRSAAQADQGSTFDFRNQIQADASYKVGPWGVDAKMTNNIGYVSTQRSQTTEEMNTDLDLNSSVEINFKSDYLPLNRMTSQGQADRIRANSLNPDEEDRIASQERTQRAQLAAQGDAARRGSLDKILTPPSSSPQPAQPAAGTPAQRPAAGGQPAGPAGAQRPAAGQPAGGQQPRGAAGQPAQGQPAQGQPAQGQPAQGQPVQGQPGRQQPPPTAAQNPAPSAPAR